MIEIVACGPLATVQDRGRPGHLSRGLAQGGAMDRAALDEADALLGEGGAAIETGGAALSLRFDAPAGIALTGAPMRATTGDGTALAWHAAHAVAAGTVLRLAPGGDGGGYSYVTPRGGILTEPVMGSRAAHLIAGLGLALRAGDRLPCAEGGADGLRLDPAPDRFRGGVLRCVPTPQTAAFPSDTVDRFTATAFRRDRRGNRQGVRLDHHGDGFAPEGGLSLVSDFIAPGDVQITGDGAPYILGPECQTTGGYPRIATVIPADLSRALQAPPGAPLRFEMTTVEAARRIATPRPAVVPLVRDPASLRDLGARQLISGVVDAQEDR